MNILICDDDNAVLGTIARALYGYCHERGILATIHPYTQSAKVNFLDKFDIAFLDIDMPEIDGIALARKLRVANPNMVIIFVTNFIQYAPEGYEVQAFRYLLKSDVSLKIIDYFDLAIQEVIKKRRVVTIKINSENIDIPVHNILYLESCGRVVIMHLIDDDRVQYRFYENMTRLSEKMEILGFLRIQKSYLVNMEYIESFQYNNIQLRGKINLPPSEKKYSELKKQYLLWRGENKWDI